MGDAQPRQATRQKGRQWGYVVLEGQKVRLPRPRLRNDAGAGGQAAQLRPLPVHAAPADEHREEIAALEPYNAELAAKTEAA